MKLFVFNRAGALRRNRADDRASVGPILSLGGSVRRFVELQDWMPTVAGLVLVANFLSAIRLPVLVEYLLCGIVLGATIGKGMVVRRERDDGELPAKRVRKIEWAWIGIGVLAMAFAVAVQAALALP